MRIQDLLAAEEAGAMAPPVRGNAAANSDQMVANLAASLAAENAAPMNPTATPLMTEPQTLEEALAIIEQQKEVINELRAQLGQGESGQDYDMNPDAYATSPTPPTSAVAPAPIY